MTPPSPNRFPAVLVASGVLAIAALGGSAAALADAGRLEQAHALEAPLDGSPPPA